VKLHPLTVCGFFLLAAPAARAQARAGARPADVAIYAPGVPDTAAARVHRLADSCAGVMTRRLLADSLVVLRHPPPLPELRRTKAATYAVIGTMTPDSGKYRVELKLWDVAADEELRSYFSGLEANPCELPAKAAPRIGTAVKEMLREARQR
jgi:hypothetical protein